MENKSKIESESDKKKRINFYDLKPVSINEIKLAMKERMKNGAVEEIHPAELLKSIL